MAELKILCWNVNGLRAIAGRGFLEWLERESPDILCLQETKVHLDQLDARLKQPFDYHTYWNYPEKKGYAGVATFTKIEPVAIEYDFGKTGLDLEGRVIITRYTEFILLNVYFPNGKKDQERLKYKMDFYDTFLDFVDHLKEADARLVVCGDFNTAHKEIDLARPKENAKVSGFLPSERDWMDKFVAHGYVDLFRQFNKSPGQYSWWDMKTGARERNVGWRIDYFFVTENLLPSISKAYIMTEVTGSDHCPVGIILKV